MVFKYVQIENESTKFDEFMVTKNKSEFLFAFIVSGLLFSCGSVDKRELRGTLSFVLSANVRAQLDPCG